MSPTESHISTLPLGSTAWKIGTTGGQPWTTPGSALAGILSRGSRDFGVGYVLIFGKPAWGLSGRFFDLGRLGRGLLLDLHDGGASEIFLSVISISLVTIARMGGRSTDPDAYAHDQAGQSGQCARSAIPAPHVYPQCHDGRVRVSMQ